MRNRYPAGRPVAGESNAHAQTGAAKTAAVATLRRMRFTLRPSSRYIRSPLGSSAPAMSVSVDSGAPSLVKVGRNTRQDQPSSTMGSIGTFYF